MTSLSTSQGSRKETVDRKRNVKQKHGNKMFGVYKDSGLFISKQFPGDGDLLRHWKQKPGGEFSTNNTEMTDRGMLHSNNEYS